MRTQHERCLVEGCVRKPPRGWRACSMHYQRMKNHGSYGPAESTMRAKGTGTDWSVDRDGYVRRTIRVEGKIVRIIQHREMMETVLGRKLVPGETVHHKNGVRDDNRPENLELWVTAQPYGQRVEDIVAWAHEVLERYGT